ncbi:hypothetical protein AC739_19155, partial [Planococcus glaciei]|uniref:hypothetical protein n=1 Tax=Planococcus glaciei TaxID=459472 RepID=UPI0006BEC49A
MNNHLLLPIGNLLNLEILPLHKEWLKKWYNDLELQISEENLSISDCFQGINTELILYGKLKTDWSKILDELLTDENSKPLAYSEVYGMNRLYKFNEQWKQSPVHAIYTHWWIRGILEEAQKREEIAELIPSLIQNNGWIYNPEVSDTQIQTRMKSELLMSMAMGIEILKHHNNLKPYSEKLLVTLMDCPNTGYISAEYFKVKAFEFLKFSPPISIHEFHYKLLRICNSGKGFSDFSITSKRDDYMGTLKRIQRDKAIDSPVISVYSHYLAQYFEESKKQDIYTDLNIYGNHLSKEPLDIPAFRMRDIDIPFGTAITPLELVASNYLIE